MIEINHSVDETLNRGKDPWAICGKTKCVKKPTTMSIDFEDFDHRAKSRGSY